MKQKHANRGQDLEKCFGRRVPFKWTASVLIGFDPDTVLDSINLVVEEGTQYAKICPEYQVANTAMRVLKLVMGTVKLHRQWSGLY